MADHAASIAAALRAATGRPVRVVVTDNRRSIWRFGGRGAVPTLRVSRLVAEGPPHVRAALVRAVRGDRDARLVVRRHFAAAIHARPPAPVRPAPRRPRPAPPGGRVAPARAPPAGHARGRRFDLAALQREIGRRYFRGWKPVSIRWGGSEGSSRRRIRLGYYDPRTHQITINPIYNRAGVPREAVGRTVYHEMLHHDMPVTISASGKREVHPPEFKRRERLYAGFAASQAWERGPLRAILRGR